MLRVYFSLGSNLGDRLGYLKIGLSELESKLGAQVLSSSVYETEPVDFIDQPHFLNLVCYLDTESSMTDILDCCKQIEFEAKRQRIQDKGPRTLDIDILLAGDLSLATEELILPHPRMSERAFVMLPLLEVAPELELKFDARWKADAQSVAYYAPSPLEALAH